MAPSGGPYDVPAQSLHRGAVADAEPEDEPLGEGLGDAPVPARHRQRVPAVDVHDAGADGHPLGRAEQERRVDERVASGDLGQPDAPVPELVDLGRELVGAPRGLEIELEGPQADASEIHAGDRTGSDYRGSRTCSNLAP